MDSKELGRFGEALAVKFLSKQGYKIVACNFRNALGELDIICRKQDELVFVEVKTRASTYFGEPFESVTIAKQKKLRRLAEAYIAQQHLSENKLRFDVLSIIVRGSNEPEINWIKYAF
ncbi:MAG: YraN family protein [Clostridia bacterium]